jgi:hypothetical protein
MADLKPPKPRKAPVNGDLIRPERWSVALNIGTLIAIIVGTIYFVIFIYQMRDAIKENIVANNVNQERLIIKSEEQIKVAKQIACLLKFHIYQDKNPYKGQCENGFNFYQP